VYIISYTWLLITWLRHVSAQGWHLQGEQCARFKTNCQWQGTVCMVLVCSWLRCWCRLCTTGTTGTVLKNLWLKCDCNIPYMIHITKIIVAVGSWIFQLVAFYVQVSSACLSPRWTGSPCLCCLGATCLQYTDRQTGMTTLTVAFRNFVDAPKKVERAAKYYLLHNSVSYLGNNTSKQTHKIAVGLTDPYAD
jgi:hypothetical protein